MSKRLKPSDVLRIARTFGDPWEGTGEEKKLTPPLTFQKVKEITDRTKQSLRK